MDNLIYKDQYKTLHESKVFDNSLPDKCMLNMISGMVIGTKSKTMLDYGCGTGVQYSEFHYNRRFNIEDKFLYLYDFAVPEHNILYDRSYDAVMCTDVLEHVPEDELDYVLKNIFSRADKMVIFAIASGPSKVLLPDGSNSHCTQHGPTWWEEKINPYNVKNIPLYVFVHS